MNRILHLCVCDPVRSKVIIKSCPSPSWAFSASSLWLFTVYKHRGWRSVAMSLYSITEGEGLKPCCAQWCQVDSLSNERKLLVNTSKKCPCVGQYSFKFRMKWRFAVFLFFIEEYIPLWCICTYQCDIPICKNSVTWPFWTFCRCWVHTCYL